MPWQGDREVIIDRFDGRAHLDFIGEYKPDKTAPPLDPDAVAPTKENRAVNYERYRILVQNEFLRVSEEKFLRTIELEEKFGGKTYAASKAKEDKKKAKEGKAAIGFVYEDSTGPTVPAAGLGPGGSDARPVPATLKSGPAGGPHFAAAARQKQQEQMALTGANLERGDGDDSDSDIDLDITVDIMALGVEQQQELNQTGKSFSLGKEHFVKFLARDIEEQEEIRAARQKEEEKAMYSVSGPEN